MNSALDEHAINAAADIFSPITIADDSSAQVITDILYSPSEE